MIPALINAPRGTAMLLGVMPCTAHCHRDHVLRVIKPKGKIHLGIFMSRESENREVWEKISRLEEREDVHGEKGRENAQRLKEHDADIQDLDRRFSMFEGSFRTAKWVWGALTGVALALLEWFKK